MGSRNPETKKEDKNMNAATFQNGNKTLTITTGETRRWIKDSMIRDYITVECDDSKRAPVRALYEIIAGKTNDNILTVGGRTFGYDLGLCCDSKTKRRSAVEAIEELVAGL